MRTARLTAALGAALAVSTTASALAGTVFTANEVSNTVSVIDTGTRKLVATVDLGDENHHRPLYNGIIDAHGANLSPDGRLLAVTGRGSSNVVFVDTDSRRVVADVLVGREPHVPTFTPDGKEAWVTVRGRDYIAVIDTASLAVKAQIRTVNGPSMVWFSPDGRLAYVGSQKEPTVAMIDVASRRTIRTTQVVGPFSPFIKLSPDGKELWITHKTVDKVSALDAETFGVLKVIDVGPRPNHVEFVTVGGQPRVYVTIGKTNLPGDQRGGENVWVIDRQSKAVVKTFGTGGKEAHGIWADETGRWIYIGHEVSDDVAVVDTAADRVVATIPVGKRPIDVVYRP
jgi:YVTN family beta-propeller protein